MNSDWEKGYWTGAGNSPWAEAGRIDRKNEEDSRRRRDAQMAAMFADRDRKRKQQKLRNEQAAAERERKVAASKQAEARKAYLAAEAEARRARLEEAEAKEAARRARLTPEQRAEEDRLVAARRAAQAQIDAERRRRNNEIIILLLKIGISISLIALTAYIIFRSFMKYPLLFDTKGYFIVNYSDFIVAGIAIISLCISIVSVCGVIFIFINGRSHLDGLGGVSILLFIIGGASALLGNQIMSSLGMMGIVHIAIAFGLLPVGWRAIRNA